MLWHLHAVRWLEAKGFLWCYVKCQKYKKIVVLVMAFKACVLVSSLSKYLFQV